MVPPPQAGWEGVSFIGDVSAKDGRSGQGDKSLSLCGPQFSFLKSGTKNKSNYRRIKALLEGEALQTVGAKRRSINSLWGQKSFLEDLTKGKTQMGIFLLVASTHMVCSLCRVLLQALHMCNVIESL